MYIYSTLMYMLGTLKADHWRLGTGTPNCHIRRCEDTGQSEVLHCSQSIPCGLRNHAAQIRACDASAVLASKRSWCTTSESVPAAN
jgi:hypothetical protein